MAIEVVLPRWNSYNVLSIALAFVFLNSIESMALAAKPTETFTGTPTSGYAPPGVQFTKYGGIHQDSNNPPQGTQLNSALSHYYSIPVATGHGLTYWSVGGYWFTANEMLRLPSDCIKHNTSPYKNHNNGSGNGNDNGNDNDGLSHVPVPVSLLAFVGFVGVAFVVNKKHKTIVGR